MKISVLSNDTLFGKMLLLEIESLKKGCDVELNNYDHSDNEAIVVLDLDSPYANGAFATTNIIGFSKNEKASSPESIKKCRVLLHRPFLISKFLEQIELMCSSVGAVAPIAVKEKNDEKRLCFLRDGLITLDGRGVHLSDNEYALIEKLYENIENPVSREELGKALSSADGNICDVYICKLRSKLESGGSERFIYTVRSKGYMLKL